MALPVVFWVSTLKSLWLCDVLSLWMFVCLPGWWTAVSHMQVHLRREARRLSGRDNVIPGHQQPAAWLWGMRWYWDCIPYHQRLSGKRSLTYLLFGTWLIVVTLGEIKQCCNLSVHLSVCPMSLAKKNLALYGYGYYRTLIGNPTLEVEPTQTNWLVWPYGHQKLCRCCHIGQVSK